MSFFVVAVYSGISGTTSHASGHRKGIQVSERNCFKPSSLLLQWCVQTQQCLARLALLKSAFVVLAVGLSKSQDARHLD